ncbi:MAG: sulfite oxidase-like oxidoreductase [Anaerolineae bacterium]
MFENKRVELEKKMQAEGRLPPGQSATIKFPILHYGQTPETDLSTWTLRIFGLVERERTLSWEEFTALPTREIVCDIHCVTRWSMFDTRWEGVSFKQIVNLAGVKPEAHFVILHAEGGYTANLPLEVMLEDDVLLAYKYDGRLLDPDHGFPLRALVPQRYFWKSAKWLRGVEFTESDRPGFWERAGYHNDANPWKEQRLAQRSGWGLF